MQKQLAIKLSAIAFITLVLMLPLQMISGKIDERAFYLAQAKQAVSDSWTTEQLLLPALLILPYEVHRKVYVTDSVSKKVTSRIQKTSYNKLIVPDKLFLSATIDNSIRQKGIYKVPVYTSEVNVSGAFSGNLINEYKKQLVEQHDKVVFKAPYFSAFVSDPRGIISIPSLTWQGQAVEFKPGSQLPKKNAGIHAYLPDIKEKGLNQFSYVLKMRGMEQLSLIPAALENTFHAASSWPHPQFIGDFLPTENEVSEQGYQAKWNINSFANNIQDKVLSCEKSSCDSLFHGALGVKHIETVDVYLQSERTVKYGLLFIGLCFITFFIFETIMKLPIHPIQYSLVGLANAIFYLLLISLSENIHFGLAYFIASFCCVALLVFYLKPILRNDMYAYVFSAVLASLYGILYIIINMEDLALMMGSFLTFLVLATVMFTTRNIDWYMVGHELSKPNPSQHQDNV
ncbi:cell envelope integrity protein CreD [Endozoicomonas sp. G2_1]|uniref:cell envelope integrity protein CreD n=1 Tax=Endozoicomonas sp. G2_1 TaxID=2821091 RepID=UPI001ADA0871|nr:cell envelope integrity protein CreD [Endozoicomonas sp. G2_1]MBO9489894.1 cell envelope integrity protein CreD [Endozoicomonas sp. G2_1]